MDIPCSRKAFKGQSLPRCSFAPDPRVWLPISPLSTLRLSRRSSSPSHECVLAASVLLHSLVPLPPQSSIVVDQTRNLPRAVYITASGVATSDTTSSPRELCAVQACVLTLLPSSGEGPTRHWRGGQASPGGHRDGRPRRYGTQTPHNAP